MLKFFRQTRQKLLSENSFSKYLLYAAGEILLVMIGILLALQVNNWNEERKLQAAELAALENLHKEFVKNQAQFEKHIVPKKELTEQWKTFLLKLGDKNLSAEERPKMRNLPPGSETLHVSFGILESLISSGKIELIRNDSLKILLANWKAVFQEFEEEETFHWETNRHYFSQYPKLPVPFSESTDGTRPQWLFHDLAEREDLYKAAFQDINYQNLMLNNYMYLQNTLYDAIPVGEDFAQIIALLEQEILKH